MDISSMFYVFIFNYIQTTDGYTYMYYVFISNYIKLLMNIPSMYYVFVSNYFSTDGYTLHVFCIYIQLF